MFNWSERQSTPAGAMAPATGREMKILIVDDEPLNIALLFNALKESYEILKAQNGNDALAMVRSHSPDLVLLDLMMPEMDGFEVCRRIRAESGHEDTPVIFVTANDSLEGEMQGLELGAVDYITKPVNIRLARLRVRNQIALRRQQLLIKEQNALLTRRKEELEAILGRIKRLEGMLSICMSCKKIRAEDQTWQQLERYVTEHSDAVFSHGLCPDCLAHETARLE